MVTTTTRRNEKGLPIVRALAIAVVAAGGLAVTNYYPSGLRLLLVAVTFGLSLLSPTAGIAIVLAGLALPMVVADLATGVVFAILAAVTLGYLSERRSSPFLVIGLAMVASSFGAEWAVPVLAGYLLGSSEGGIAAVIACVAIEAAGLLLGLPRIGAVVTGGASAALHFRPVAQPFAFAWLGRALHGVSAARLVGAFTSAKYLSALIAQPIAWGGAAWIAGRFQRPASDRKRLPIGLALAGACALGLAAASAFVTRAFAAAVPAGTLGTAASISLVVAVAGVLLAEGVFGLKVAAVPGQRSTTEQDDADVDELLRKIAEAEDELASKHTSEAVVMITDMQSFSTMTEEDGSMVSAKMIQRHRDLLLPLIERFGGHGKSTGGDGLVAAFSSAEHALQAAVEMQRALRDFNAARPGERQLKVRIGIAKGEVVLDRNGRPFIGAGLNKAARVMNLADGGEVFADAKLAGSLGPIPWQSHGAHELKNIAEPVEVVELLWDDQAASRAAS